MIHRSCPKAAKPETARKMRSNRAGRTKPEVALRSLLHRMGYRFRKDFLISGEGFRTRADIAFPKSRIAIFVDGCFWHCCPQHGTIPKLNMEYWIPKLKQNVDRDFRATEALRSAGWTVMRLWEHEAINEAVLRVVGALHGSEDGTSQGDGLRATDDQGFP